MDVVDLLPDIDASVNNASNAVLIDNPGQCKAYIESKRGSFTIISQNIRSLNHNINDFEILLTQLGIDAQIIVLTECWLSCTSRLPIIPEYTPFATSTHINQNSGIVVYIKDNLKQVKVSEPQIDDANCMLVEICSQTAIICIYRPPCYYSVERFQNTLDKLLTDLKKTQNIVLVGDINIDIKEGNVDNRSSEYLSPLATHAMLPTHLLPTRLANCLDHSFTKSRNEIRTIVCESTITDHYTVVTNIKHKALNKPDRPTKILKTDYQALSAELTAVGWDEVLSNCSDVNTTTSTFIKILSDIYQKHTQFKQISNRKRAIKPWVTPGLLRCIRFRDQLHQKTKKNPDNETLRISYIRYRTHCNRILKNLKKQYEKKLIQENKNNIKNTWRAIKKICNIEKKTQSASELLQNSNTISNINNHFASVGRKLATTILDKLKLNEIDLVKLYKAHDNTPLNSFVLLPTDTNEIKKIILSLRSSASTGWDGCSSILYKKPQILYQHP